MSYGAFRPNWQVMTAHQAATSANRKANDAATTVNYMEKRLDHLTLVCRAMWELIEERTDLKERDLLQKIAEVDLADGQADGRVQRKVVDCAECGRPVSSRQTRCMYCGHERAKDSPFDG